MKYIITLLATLFTLQANAAFISLETNASQYAAGDLVDVRMMVDNSAANIAELDFGLRFDETLASYQDSGFNVLNTQWAMVTDAFLSASNTLSVYSLWFDNLDVPVGVFELASASFTAQSAFSAQSFELINVYIADSFGDQIANTPQVSEPASLAMLLMGLGVMGFRRKAHASLPA
ncbi:PEP-CTERM sorting domain-containing protein [Agarivorans sp. QJM3NY_33]|uniref:PEP-CTERM sorting domain-containing protein n=1 Tax=Agarivorans sp. QJM3NY_33 TaxID=3421432 RepID=UPI003D7EE587